MPELQTNLKGQDIRDQQRHAAQALTAMVQSGLSSPIGSETNLLPESERLKLSTLNDIQVKSFTVTPSSIRPKSGGTEIKWSVDIPAGLSATISINDVPVGSSGSMIEDPVATKFYWLAASQPGMTRLLGVQTVLVDNTGCLEEKSFDLPLLQTLASHTAYVTKGFKDGVSYEVGGITAVATMESQRDLNVTEDGGLVLFTLKISLTLAGFIGGTVRSNVWLRLFPHDGNLAHLVDRSDTSYDLPPGIWVLAVFGGPTWLLVTEALRELIRQKIDPKLRDAIAQGFSLDAFFKNVVSVEVQPEKPDQDARIFMMVRKAACL